MMIGMKDMIQLFEGRFSEDEKRTEMYKAAINRLNYEKNKTEGIKPKYHRGARINDWYTCGNCGHGLHDIGDNYCSNCGHRIKWNSTRCLTK